MALPWCDCGACCEACGHDAGCIRNEVAEGDDGERS